ncbi:MAG: family 1 encapsulin nanocompartment shell protein [Spirochaetota bacterium]
MDLLKRTLAPISTEGWEEIDSTAKETLETNLSARKSVDVTGPLGLDYTSVNLGRLKLGKSDGVKDVQYGTYQLQPLTETRISFKVKTWELDNLARGAKDIELEEVVEAARKMAQFEEQAVYSGFKDGSITGLQGAAAFSAPKLKQDAEGIINAVADGQMQMQKAGVNGGADLIVEPELWKFLNRPTQGGTLKSIVEQQLGGNVILSEAVSGAVLLANRGGDTELILGQDFSIGYHHHTSEDIFLFLTESFTFRVITPEAIVAFTA